MPPQNAYYNGQFTYLHDQQLTIEQLVMTHCIADLTAFEGYLYQQAGQVGYLGQLKQEVIKSLNDEST